MFLSKCKYSPFVTNFLKKSPFVVSHEKMREKSYRGKYIPKPQSHIEEEQEVNETFSNPQMMLETEQNKQMDNILMSTPVEFQGVVKKLKNKNQDLIQDPQNSQLLLTKRNLPTPSNYPHKYNKKVSLSALEL